MKLLRGVKHQSQQSETFSSYRTSLEKDLFTMNSFKSYFHPASKTATAATAAAKKDGVARAGPIEMANTPPAMSPAIGRSPMSSRPSSLYPQGDFRNSPRESILDIKSDVMVSWLHQQQLERLWSSGSFGEGVVLKKTRADYACCPNTLREVDGGIFHQVVSMNVKVSLSYIKALGCS